MKTTFLLPHIFQKIGWAILIPAALLGVAYVANGWNWPAGWSQCAERWLNNVVLIGSMAGGLLVTCSREKEEDEMIGRLRLDALLTAFCVNYSLLIVACLCVYSFRFVNVMIYNLFTPMLIYLALFRYRLWRVRKEVGDDE